jgi:ABC-type glycerol-3-phosphate transport system substrate-binding protein
MSAELPTNLTYDLYPLIYQAGGDVIDEKTNKAVFNSPAGVKAVQWYVDLMNVHKVSVPGILSSGEKEKRANFAAGNIAMMFEGSFGIPIQRQMNANLQFDVAPMPRETTTGTVVRGAVNCMTTQAKNKEAAWKFMRWLHGPVGIEMWPGARSFRKTSPSRRGSRRKNCSRFSYSNCSFPTPSHRTWGCRMRSN